MIQIEEKMALFLDNGSFRFETWSLQMSLLMTLLPSAVLTRVSKQLWLFSLEDDAQCESIYGSASSIGIVW